jgi:hypothetical protein
MGLLWHKAIVHFNGSFKEKKARLRDLLDQNIGADESKNRDVKVKIVQSNTDICQILSTFLF